MRWVVFFVFCCISIVLAVSVEAVHIVRDPFFNSSLSTSIALRVQGSLAGTVGGGARAAETPDQGLMSRCLVSTITHGARLLETQRMTWRPRQGSVSVTVAGRSIDGPTSTLEDPSFRVVARDQRSEVMLDKRLNASGVQEQLTQAEEDLR